MAGGASLWMALTVVSATVVPWMDLGEITGKAEVIVLGIVESAESGWSDDGHLIVTRAVVTVERTLKGGPRDRIRVECLGGTTGGQTMVVPGAPVLRVGDRLVLFLEPLGRPEGVGGAPAGGAGRSYAVVGFNQGRMSVRRDPRTGRDVVEDRTAGTLYLDRQGRPLGAERSGKGPVELQRFLEDVARLVQGGPARESAP